MQRVKQVGALMDDFSLLRISFNEDFINMEEQKDIPYQVTESVMAGMELIDQGNPEEAVKK